MRLPPQVSAVLRSTINRPVRASVTRGAWASGTSESVNCQTGESICNCGNGTQYACCTGGSCHIDTITGLCLCGTGTGP